MYQAGRSMLDFIPVERESLRSYTHIQLPDIFTQVLGFNHLKRII